MPIRFDYHLLDVFTDRPFGGNPLAVVPDARAIPERFLPRIAREFNLSETVFVLPPDSADGLRRLRIFTPGTELPFAGHPTIGTAHLLGLLGLAEPPASGAGLSRFVLEEAAGPVPVTLEWEGGRPAGARFVSPRLPEFGPPPPADAELARMLGLDASEILDGAYIPAAASCGVPFLFVPLRSRLALDLARLDVERWAETAADFWAPHVYVFCPDGPPDRAAIRSRMFGPGMGIPEDPATGAAAAALAGYLAARSGVMTGTLRWTIEQGVEMGRPSRLAIEASLRSGRIAEVVVGGQSVRIGGGAIELP